MKCKSGVKEALDEKKILCFNNNISNLHLYIEYIEGEKFPKNKLYTRYTQEHGQLKLSKKGKWYEGNSFNKIL